MIQKNIKNTKRNVFTYNPRQKILEERKKNSLAYRIKRKAQRALQIGLAAYIMLSPANLGSKIYEYFVRFSDGSLKKIQSVTTPKEYLDVFRNYIGNRFCTDINEKHEQKIFVNINRNQNDREIKKLENRLGGTIESLNDIGMINYSLAKEFKEKMLVYLPHIETKKIPKEVIIAIGAHESEWGTSELAVNYKNIYGIKEYFKEGINLQTHEYKNKKKEIISKRFRVYKSAEESIKDFLSLKIVQKARDRNPEKMIDKLHKYGYATDPQWAKKVKMIICELNYTN